MLTKEMILSCEQYTDTLSRTEYHYFKRDPWTIGSVWDVFFKARELKWIDLTWLTTAIR